MMVNALFLTLIVSNVTAKTNTRSPRLAIAPLQRWLCGSQHKRRITLSIPRR
jgi:hypothetical protein